MLPVGVFLCGIATVDDFCGGNFLIIYFLRTSFSMAVLGIVLFLAGRVVWLIFRRGGRSTDLKSEAVLACMMFYLLALALLTLGPTGAGRRGYATGSINLVPLIFIAREVASIGTAYNGDIFFTIKLILANVGGNVLLFVPIGVFAPLLDRHRSMMRTIGIGLCISVSIELLQLLETLLGLTGRITDIDDVLCNVAGTVVGWLIYRSGCRMYTQFRSHSGAGQKHTPNANEKKQRLNEQRIEKADGD
jgi:glycopeptide antibiotics resistance protein